MSSGDTVREPQSHAGHPPGHLLGIAVKLNPEAHKQIHHRTNFLSNVLETHAASPKKETVSHFTPLITSQPPEVVQAKVALAAQLDPTYQPVDFSTWQKVSFRPLNSDADLVSADQAPMVLAENISSFAKHLHELPEVESAQAAEIFPPPFVDPSDDPRSEKQGYLDAAPTGVDVRYAWGFPGGDGEGVNMVDMEQGWDLEHEDLV
jgi:serine protease